MDLRQLRLQSASGWEPLPPWAKALIDLGMLLARHAGSNSRLTMGLLLPARAYAAILISTGIVLARTGDRGLSETDRKAHFQRLLALPSEASVIHYSKTKICKGTIVSHAPPYVGVRVNKATTHLINEEIALTAWPMGGPEPLWSPFRSKSCIDREEPSAFTEQLLGKDLAAAFTAQPQLDCLIAGQTALIQAEITQAITLGDPAIKGSFQDILRARRFLPSHLPFRTEVVAGRESLEEHVEQPGPPPLVIADGSAAYRAWSRRWPRSSHVLILDRTDSGASAALAQLTSAISRARSANDLLEANEPLPRSMDAALWREDS